MPKLLIIDTETGGLDPGRYSILSIAAAIWDDSIVGDSFEAYILEPNLHVEREAMEVNRIDLQWLQKNGLAPSEAVSRLHSFLDKSFGHVPDRRPITLAGHNVSFDISFLKRLYTLAGVNFDDFYSHRALDTASLIQFLILAGRMPLSEASSTAAFSHFGITFGAGERHSALGDAIATAKLLSKLIELVRTPYNVMPVFSSPMQQ